MAKTISPGYTDTVVEGATDLTVGIDLNWTADHRVTVDDPGEVMTINTTTPVDQPESFRFSQRKLSDVYNGLGIDPSAYLPVRQGTATLVECRETWSEVDSEDSTYRKLFPVKCGITLQVPAYGNITADAVLALVQRTVAALFDEGDNTSAGISALLHGAIKKSEL